jgi:hypothetical protein
MLQEDGAEAESRVCTNSEAEARPVINEIMSIELARVGTATRLNKNL